MRALLAILMVATPVPAFADATVFGIGHRSCATAFSTPTYRQQSEDWISGFWSGLNTADQAFVGEGSDPFGRLTEIERFCRNDPSAPLAVAALRIYEKFKALGR